MLAILPERLDKSAGQFPYEFTMPTATELAELLAFTFPEAIKAIFPMWAEGAILDYHAQTRGITRKPAAFANGVIAVSGVRGTEIPKGFQFTTAATYNKPGIPFETVADTTVTTDPVLVAVRALTAGLEGNVAAHAVIYMTQPMAGITGMTNQAAMSGGMDEESDEALRQRVMDFDANQGARFIGCEADYKMWAMEVQGVGAVQIKSATDDSGTVHIILTDLSGDPASIALCKTVYDHIMSPEIPSLRKPPINALLNVIPPTTVQISVSARLVLDGTSSLADIQTNFFHALKQYFKQNEIRWTQIGALLLDLPGVRDYTNLLVNGGTQNITVAVGEIPQTKLENLMLTVGDQT